MSNGNRSVIAGLACVIAIAAGCANDSISQAEKGEKHAPDFAQTRAIAREGLVYGLPIVMNYAVNYEFFIDTSSPQYKCPFNVLKNESRVFTYKDTSVVTPNSDTPYSFIGMDLRAEPIVISVPPIEQGRYYSVQFIDWNTFNFGYIGSRATGNGGGDYLVVGPDWKGRAPDGIKQVFTSSTQFAIGLFRTQLLGPSDMPNVLKVQAGYRAVPLSTYAHTAPPPPPPQITWPKIDKDLAKLNFFEYLDFAMQFAPAGPEEKPIREKLASIGIGPGKSFNFNDLSLEHKLEVGLGMKDGEQNVEERAASLGKSINGWQIGAAFGDRKYYNGNWMLRAAAAKAGIYGNDAIEAVYPMARQDGTGQVLDGASHNYTLTFPAGNLPPVNAFWSVTMYDGKTQLLIENPIGRYLINSPMLPNLKKNADGSLTIYIQHSSPGADKESNWLPAPAGPMYIVMRLYWPRTQPPSVLPAGEGTWQPPAIQRVN